MSIPNRMKSIILGVIAATGMALVPLTFSSEGDLALSKVACLITGTCCRERGSICNAGGSDRHGYYYKEAGRCSP